MVSVDRRLLMVDEPNNDRRDREADGHLITVNASQLPLLPQHRRHQARESSGSRRLIGFLAFGILLGVAFGQSLTSLAKYAAITDLHSHILLVPFISAYLIYHRYKQLPKAYSSSWGWGLLSLLLGLGSLFTAGNLIKVDPALSQNDSLSLTAFSFVCLLAMGGFLFLGRKWMTAAAFPFAFLIFMVPLPDAIVHWLETASKLASAEAAALFFSVVGIPVLRDGTVFQLPGIAIEVAQECSGIRSSWVLFITSLLASYLFLRSPWRRAILIFLVIPLAIARNGFRILVIGLLCVQLGPQMINSVIHHRGGPLFFALSLIPLLLLLWWLRRGEQGKAEISKFKNAEISKCRDANIPTH
jgi:exosortase C (VPDSG-CTERM-specific)